MMAGQTYRVSGRVLDSQTESGVPNLRVEAWDKDTKYHDMLGIETTDARGRFQMAFDEFYFGDFAPDRMPDLFFKVFLGRKLIKSTEGEVMWNVAPGDTDVTIEVDMPQPPPARRDRVKVGQVMQGVDFVRRSDFRGIGREARDRTSVFGGVLGDMVRTRFAAGPLKAPDTRARDVVGQDVSTAEANLARQQVEVNEVRSYQPGLDTQSVKSLGAFPFRLKPGQKVDLYTDDQGKIRYYSVARKPAAVAAADIARVDSDIESVKADLAGIKASPQEGDNELARTITAMKAQQTEVERLKHDLQTVREESAAKDQEIAALREELTTLRAQQEDHFSKVSPQRIERLEKDIDRLRS